jgi:hypothetical protein
MRKLMLGAVLALVLPAAAMAGDDTTSPADLAATACKTEKSEMGKKTFKLTYGSAETVGEAKDDCLDGRSEDAKDDHENAAKACKTERARNEEAFAAKYGTNKNKRNAFGKCVSGKAKHASEEDTHKRVSAAHKCRAEKKSDPVAFAEDYGKGKNAFGKCVSKTAREQHESEDTDHESEDTDS